MNDLGITPADRKVVVVARQKKAEETGGPAPALNCGWGNLGKNSELSPTAAALINAIKKSADIAKEVKLIEPEVVKPIQGLKIDHSVVAIHAFIQMKPDCTLLSQLQKILMLLVLWKSLATPKEAKLTQPSF